MLLPIWKKKKSLLIPLILINTDTMIETPLIEQYLHDTAHMEFDLVIKNSWLYFASIEGIPSLARQKVRRTPRISL